MKNIELIVGKAIMSIVIIATIISCVGAIMYYLEYGNQIISYNLFQLEPKAYTSFFGIWREAFSLSPKGIMQLGILLLVSGQSIRVLFTFWIFAKGKEYSLCFASLFIFSVLLYGLFGFSI